MFGRSRRRCRSRNTRCSPGRSLGFPHPCPRADYWMRAAEGRNSRLWINIGGLPAHPRSSPDVRITVVTQGREPSVSLGIGRGRRIAVPCTLPGVRQGDRICRIARKAVSLRRPFGDQARAVDPAPLFQAPLFRPDGVLGRVLAQILCTRSIDAGPSLEGIEERI